MRADVDLVTRAGPDADVRAARCVRTMTLRWPGVARLSASVLVVLLTAGNAGGQDRGPALDAETGLVITGGLRPGRYAVGFSRTVMLLPQSDADETRPSAVDLYRWYPAAASANVAAPMTLADYYRTQYDDGLDDESLRERLRGDMTDPAGITATMLDEALGASLWASYEAPPTRGTFPLVLWSYRDSIPTMQPLLGEYRASHGYHVVFGWPRDRVPPFPWDQDVSSGARVAALEVQVEMLAGILDGVGAEPGVDAAHTAVLAWSYGGESAHGLQRRVPGIDVVIGIDANLVSGWVYRSAEDLANLGAAELVVPHVLIRHGSARVGAPETPPPDLLSSVAGGAWYVRLPLLHHGNFNFPGGMLPGVLGLDEVSEWAVGGETARRGYEAVCQLALRFVTSSLAQGALAQAEGVAIADDLVEITRVPPRDVERR